MRALAILLLLTGCTVPINVDLHTTNAWSTADSVIITSKMSQLIDTRGELAFVMAHELGHIVLQHHYQEDTPTDEMDADRFAFQSVMLAGHSPCHGVSALSKIAGADRWNNIEFQARVDHWRDFFFEECGEDK